MFLLIIILIGKERICFYTEKNLRKENLMMENTKLLRALDTPSTHQKQFKRNRLTPLNKRYCEAKGHKTQFNKVRDWSY